MSHKLATCELRDFLYRLDRSFVIVQSILFDIIIQNPPYSKVKPNFVSSITEKSGRVFFYDPTIQVS